jgi:hypothetical protein
VGSIGTRGCGELGDKRNLRMVECGERIGAQAPTVVVDANRGKEKEMMLWCLRGGRRGHRWLRDGHQLLPEAVASCYVASHT